MTMHLGFDPYLRNLTTAHFMRHEADLHAWFRDPKNIASIEAQWDLETDRGGDGPSPFVRTMLRSVVRALTTEPPTYDKELAAVAEAMVSQGVIAAHPSMTDMWSEYLTRYETYSTFNAKKPDSEESN